MKEACHMTDFPSDRQKLIRKNYKHKRLLEKWENDTPINELIDTRNEQEVIDDYLRRRYGKNKDILL